MQPNERTSLDLGYNIYRQNAFSTKDYYRLFAQVFF